MATDADIVQLVSIAAKVGIVEGGQGRGIGSLHIHSSTKEGEVSGGRRCVAIDHRSKDIDQTEPGGVCLSQNIMQRGKLLQKFKIFLINFNATDTVKTMSNKATD